MAVPGWRAMREITQPAESEGISRSLPDQRGRWTARPAGRDLALRRPAGDLHTRPPDAV